MGWGVQGVVCQKLKDRGGAVPTRIQQQGASRTRRARRSGRVDILPGAFRTKAHRQRCGRQVGRRAEGVVRSHTAN
eukprot:6211824-Pleurochrysis_carterae.AAC.1